jgi:hypothetical protein
VVLHRAAREAQREDIDLERCGEEFLQQVQRS